MGVAALDLTDACLTLVLGSTVLAAEEGCAHVGPAGPVFGAAALALSRVSPLQFAHGYWRDLSDAPLARPLAGFRSSAELAGAHLAHLHALLPTSCEGVVIATPPYWSADQLGLLLGLASECGMRVTALVDGAVAAARRPWEGAALVQLEATLDDLWLARIGQEAGAALIGRERASDGVVALRRHAAGYFAQCFLRTSRFDPLHDPAVEQQLYDRLPGWADRLADAPEATVELMHDGTAFRGVARTTALRDHLAAALEPAIRRLRSIGGAAGRTILQVPAYLGAIPGVLDALVATAPLEVVWLAPGEAARGALRAPRSSGVEGLRVLTSLPWDQPALTNAPAARAEGRRPQSARAPTHLLHEGAAYRLGATALHIGQELGAGEYGIALPATLRGVSRRHCTIRLEGDNLVVHDHSRFGTSLNGHRVEGPAVLHAGDRLQVGQPPQDFVAIAEVAP